MKHLVLGAVVAACATGAATPARAMDMFVEGAFGAVFESDVDVAGTSQMAEADVNAFVAFGAANVGGAVDIRLEYATTDRIYENSLFAQLQSSSLMLNASGAPSISTQAAGLAWSMLSSTAPRSSSTASTAAKPCSAGSW